jgi:hypothetical protein
MTQIQIQYTITDGDLQKRLDQIIDRTQDLTPVLADLGEYLVRKTRKRFDT